MLLSLLAISAVAYGGLLTALLFHLERRNPAIWRELRAPSWFLMPFANSWALLKFLFAGTRDELHPTVRHLVTGTRLTLLLTVIFFLLLGLQQGSGPGPEG
jgi:hypothetical protein